MLELTSEELAMSPQWATHYTKSECESLVVFYDGYKRKSMRNGKLSAGCMKCALPVGAIEISNRDKEELKR